MNIKIEVSCGELIDKITILRIKRARITSPEKLSNVKRELQSLEEAWFAAVGDESRVSRLIAELQGVNENLWDIEDRLRVLESDRRFDTDFVELARQVYITNDRRARLKREINLSLGSEFVEEKQYVHY
jgi:hypothetical protein